jgi:hypothetical protein
MKLLEFFSDLGDGVPLTNNLVEKRITLADGFTFNVYKNLSADQLLRIAGGMRGDNDRIKLRGITDGSDIYWWDAYYGIHYDVCIELGLSYDLGFKLYITKLPGGEGLYLGGYLKFNDPLYLDWSNPAIERFLVSPGANKLLYWDSVKRDYVYLNSFKRSLTNNLVEERVWVGDHEFQVYKNLPYDRLVALAWASRGDGDERLRGLLHGSDVYWWDGLNGIHRDVAEGLGFNWGAGDKTDVEEIWVGVLTGERYGGGALLFMCYGDVRERLSRVPMQRLMASKDGGKLYVYDKRNMLTVPAASLFGQKVMARVVTEGIIRVENRDREVLVLKNPMYRGLAAFMAKTEYKELRGLVDGDDVYFWDSYDGYHESIGERLGVGVRGNNKLEVIAVHGYFHISISLLSSLWSKGLMNVVMSKGGENLVIELNYSSYPRELTGVSVEGGNEYYARVPVRKVIEFYKTAENYKTMSMREGSLVEEKVVVNDKTVRLLKNPTYLSLVRFIRNTYYKEVRGLIVGDDVFWWDSVLSIHEHMGNALGVTVYDNKLELIQRDDGTLLNVSYFRPGAFKCKGFKNLVLSKGGQNVFVNIYLDDGETWSPEMERVLFKYRKADDAGAVQLPAVELLK